MSVKEELNEGHTGEAMDRLYIILGMIDDYLLSHPIIMEHAHPRMLIEWASRDLSEAYQFIGSLPVIK